MDNNILLLLFAFLFSVFLMRSIMESALKKITPEFKLVLLDSFSGLRKYRSIGTISLVGIYFMLLYFFIPLAGVITLGFIVVFIIYFVIIQYITYRKLKGLNAPEFYISRYLISVSIFSVALIGLFTHSYFQFTKKTAYEYERKAFYDLRSQNYQAAIDGFTKAIEIDSMYYYFTSRGTAKYYSNDTAGACADWQQGATMGDTAAVSFMRDFCK